MKVLRVLLVWILFFAAFAAPLVFALAQPVSSFVQSVTPGVVPIGTPTVIASFGSGVVNVSSITTTTSAAIVSGDLVIIEVYMNASNAVDVSSISDGTNSYSLAVREDNLAQTGNEVEIWYKANATAVGSGATITVDLSGSTGASSGIAIVGAQVSGVLTSSPLDQTAGAQGTTAASLTMTTSSLAKANEIAFGIAAIIGPETYDGASGFNNLTSGETSAGNGEAWLDYKVVASMTGVTYAPTWATGSSRVTAAVATFKGN